MTYLFNEMDLIILNLLDNINFNTVVVIIQDYKTRIFITGVLVCLQLLSFFYCLVKLLK